MSKYCVDCGKEVPDCVSYCSECGARVPDNKHNEYTHSEQAATTARRTVYHETANTPRVVSTAYYFGMMFLYSLPLVGWLICLITAFAGFDINKKNFARAMLIWMIIGFIVSVIVTAMSVGIGGLLAEEFSGLSTSEIQGILEQIPTVETPATAL